MVVPMRIERISLAYQANVITVYTTELKMEPGIRFELMHNGFAIRALASRVSRQFVLSESNTRPPTCKEGALPTELKTHWQEHKGSNPELRFWRSSFLPVKLCSHYLEGV